MTTSLHFPHKSSQHAIQNVVGPSVAPLRWLRLRIINLPTTGCGCAFDTDDCEAALDILTGTCTVELLAPEGKRCFPGIGGRTSVFDELPTVLYIPRLTSVRVMAESAGFHAALVLAPARADLPARLVTPPDVEVRTVGKDNWQRTVATAIGDNVEADRLLLGETVNPAGNWSSSPPHKHDRRDGDEVALEEVYYYQLDPPQGFGLQRIYTPPSDPAPFDVTYAVRHGDAIALPRGYHPVVAAPGYRLYYLWALAGEERRYGAWSDDPEHAWVKRP
jgi:5-deoxy-glucuronate isomerase